MGKSGTIYIENLRGNEIYERLLRDQVEVVSNNGKFVVVDIGTGDYAIDNDVIAAGRRLFVAHPAAVTWTKRIVYVQPPDLTEQDEEILDAIWSDLADEDKLHGDSLPVGQRKIEMTLYEATIAKIQQMPEPLVQKVQDYVDFLLTRNDNVRWQAVQQLAEATTLTDADLSDYLPNLEDYEERLARGEVKW